MRRHDLDLTSLLVGIVFLAVAATYLIGQATGTRLDASWLGPLILVSLGLAGFVGGIARSWRGGQADNAVTEPTGTEPTGTSTAAADTAAEPVAEPVDEPVDEATAAEGTAQQPGDAR